MGFIHIRVGIHAGPVTGAVVGTLNRRCAAWLEGFFLDVFVLSCCSCCTCYTSAVELHVRCTWAPCVAAVDPCMPNARTRTCQDAHLLNGIEKGLVQ
eukprot:1139970-Pelagomonas_calceolata.AAC.6